MFQIPKSPRVTPKRRLKESLFRETSGKGTKERAQRPPNIDPKGREERTKSGRKRKSDEKLHVVDHVASKKSRRYNSPSYLRLRKVAERLSKEASPQDKSERVSSPHGDSDNKNSSEPLKEKPDLGSSIKPNSTDVNIVSKPLGKGIFTRKSPLVPKTFSKSPICTKFPKKPQSAEGKPQGIVEPIPKKSKEVRAKTKIVSYGWSSDEDNDKNYSNNNNNVNKSYTIEAKVNSDDKSRKKRKSPNTGNVSQDDGGRYYDNEETGSSSKSYLSYKHVPKNKPTSPVRDLMSFKVRTV